MKKIVVLAALAFAAVASQAATIQWGSDRNGAKDFAEKTVYLVDGASLSEIIAVLDAGGADVASEFNKYVLGSAIVASNGSTVGETSGVTKYASFIVFDADIADGVNYYATPSVDVTDNLYNPPDPAAAKYKFTTASFTTTGTVGSAAVPEPTSGLLLLLGMAGLALRRKVA